MKLSANFTFDQVRFDTNADAHLVVELQAPPVQTGKRPPLCIMLVADKSGSMGGDKLRYAKLSMEKLVDHLSPNDTCGLVVFSSNAEAKFHPVKMTVENKAKLKSTIGHIPCSGGTNFADGMLLGCQIANDLDMPIATAVRVIMFSDGQPESGIATTAPELKALLSNKRGRTTVSMFGFGGDAEHELLGVLAAEGQGNYAHVPNPDSALAAFGKELGGLLSSYADNIVVTLTPNAGHTISDVVSDFPFEKEVDGEVSVSVPAMLAEEIQHLVLGVKLAAQPSPGPRSVNAVNVKISYRTVEDGNPVIKSLESKAKVQFVKGGDEQKSPTKALDEIVCRAQLVRAQDAAEKEAKKGHYDAAKGIMTNFQTSTQSRGHDRLSDVSKYMSSNYENVGAYAASSGGRTVMRSAMSRGLTKVSGLSGQDAAVLRSAGLQASTSTQTVTSNSFSGVVGGAVVIDPIDPSALKAQLEAASQDPVPPTSSLRKRTSKSTK